MSRPPGRHHRILPVGPLLRHDGKGCDTKAKQKGARLHGVACRKINSLRGQRLNITESVTAVRPAHGDLGSGHP
ncbi:hypothetical protein DC347_12320 [Pseudarthrobacter sp. AG30]|nr:hypothetical protein DC347_12320 [Pseudarthrobacter sp. AG30]